LEPAGKAGVLSLAACGSGEDGAEGFAGGGCLGGGEEVGGGRDELGGGRLGGGGEVLEGGSGVEGVGEGGLWVAAGLGRGCGIGGCGGEGADGVVAGRGP